MLVHTKWCQGKSMTISCYFLEILDISLRESHRANTGKVAYNLVGIIGGVRDSLF